MILIGDVCDKLRELPEASVHCVVTSPPYWGLRDYGTGEWEGGDAECDHVRIDNAGVESSTLGGGKGNVHDAYAATYRDICGKCGAKRVDHQIGLEPTMAEFVDKMVAVFREVKRVLRDDGTCWVNLGDSYGRNPAKGGSGPNGKEKEYIGENYGSAVRERATRATGVGALGGGPNSEARHLQGLVASGSEERAMSSILERNGDAVKPKDLCGIPWRVAFALQADGWYLRSDIIWSKPNPMPESVTDRPTKAHEYLFLLTKSARYYYDADAIREAASPNTMKYNPRYANVNPDNPYYFKSKDKPKSVAHLLRGSLKYVSPNRNKRTVWTIPTQPFSGWTQTSRLVRVAQGEPSDDMTHIASQDCPTHVDAFAQIATAFCGEHAADVLNDSSRIGARLAKALRGERGPFPMLLQDCYERHSWDSQHLDSFLSATGRNSESHRTDPAPETMLSCMPFAEMISHIDDKSEQLLWFGIYHGMNGNSISLDGKDARLLDRIPHRRIGKSSYVAPPDCSCEYYTISQESTSHFATYPEALVKPCILAGCPGKVCAVCGAPWVREIEAKHHHHHNTKPTNPGGGVAITPGAINTGQVLIRENITLGWSPTCTHDADTTGGTVLDPFLGSGTTAVVAAKEGRQWIGVELNPEYAALAEKRIPARQEMLL